MKNFDFSTEAVYTTIPYNVTHTLLNAQRILKELR